MKIIAITVLALTLTAAFFHIGAPEALCQSKRIAEVIHVSGSAKLKSATVLYNWVEVQEGMIVKEGDIIRTEANSSVELAFGEGLDNIIKVFPNSQLVISKFEPGLVKLEEGRVFTLIKKLKRGSTFEVRTPTAVAGARGTGWGVGFKSMFTPLDSKHLTGFTEVKGFEETVYVAGLDVRQNPAGLKDLNAGWGTSIAEGEGPSEFRRLGGEEMDFWRGWKKDALKHLRDYKKAKPWDRTERKEKLEHRAKILERVERETARTEEIKRDRRTQGGASEGDSKGRQY